MKHKLRSRFTAGKLVSTFKFEEEET